MSTLTFWQRGLALAVEHDVDPREGNVSEQRGHKAREQSCRTFSLTHRAQSPDHTPVTVPATLKHKNTHIYFSYNVHTIHQLKYRHKTRKIIVPHTRTSRQTNLFFSGTEERFKKNLQDLPVFSEVQTKFTRHPDFLLSPDQTDWLSSHWFILNGDCTNF